MAAQDPSSSISNIDYTSPSAGQQVAVDLSNPAPADVPADLSARQAPPSPQPTDPNSQSYQPADTINTAPQKPSLWRNVLAGALQGLAAGSAVNTHGMGSGGAFAAGAGAGANQVLNVQPAQQQQLDMNKAQVAAHYASLAHIQREINLMPDSKQEQYLTEAADQGNAMIKSGAATPLSQPSDLITAQQKLQSLHAQNPWAVYSIVPQRNEDGDMSYVAVQFAKAPLQQDLPLKGAGDKGEDITIPAGTPADQVGKYYTNFLSKRIENEAKSALADKNNAARSALADKNNASKNQRAAITASGQNVVAFDPEYQNADGSKGGNVVLDKATAQQRGLFNYKVDPSVVNANVAGFNDVQNKINQLADVANDPKRMSQVQSELAAAILAHGKGITLGISGTSIDTSRVNESLYKEDVAKANQATRDYVTAMVAAHEAITQLPRLQTFGKSSRMTQQQMEAAQNMLPHPGDGPQLAAQKMDSLQTTIDPLRRQLPHMPGAELIPSWKEKQAKPPAATHTYDPFSRTLNLINGLNGGGQ
jgi:hypothetical protein